MKTTKKWSKALLAGMAALLCAFGLVIVGCDTGNNDNNNDNNNNNGGGNVTYSVEVKNQLAPAASLASPLPPPGMARNIAATDTVELYINNFEYLEDAQNRALILIADGDRLGDVNRPGEYINNAGWFSFEEELSVINALALRNTGSYSAFQINISKLKVNGTEYNFPSPPSGRSEECFGNPSAVWQEFGFTNGYAANFPTGITIDNSTVSLKTILTVEPGIIGTPNSAGYDSNGLATDPYQYIKVEGITSSGGGTGGGTSSRTLVITNINEALKTQGQKGFNCGIITPGTTLADAGNGIGLVAETKESKVSTSGTTAPYTATVPLYAAGSSNTWADTGTFDIYLELEDGGGTKHYYLKQNVSFTAASISVDAATFLPVGAGNTLVITNVSAAMLAQGAKGLTCAIVNPGTTLADAGNGIGLVAETEDSEVRTTGPVASVYTTTVPLYVHGLDSASPWTGTGIYDIYLGLIDGSDNMVYSQAQNISFTAATITSVDATSFSPITP
jgi:hypothetical protein